MEIELDRTINAANAILVAIENTFNTNSVVLPDRQYIAAGAAGSVAYDCEQLSISWEQNYTGKPGNPNLEASRCAGFRSGSFIVELVRPTPISFNADIPPEAHLIQEAAEGIMRDAELLYNAGVLVAETHNDILDGGIVAVTVSAPAGGYQALVMTVDMPI